MIDVEVVQDKLKFKYKGEEFHRIFLIKIIFIYETFNALLVGFALKWRINIKKNTSFFQMQLLLLVDREE